VDLLTILTILTIQTMRVTILTILTIYLAKSSILILRTASKSANAPGERRFFVKRAALAEDWRPGGLESRRRRRWDGGRVAAGWWDGGGFTPGVNGGE
jgi:hypothetical protein